METKTPNRRVHSAELKAEVLGECRQPGASIAAVALAHGLNANLVRKWLVGRGMKHCGLQAPGAVRPVAPSTLRAAAGPAAETLGPDARFVALQMPGAGPQDIHVELRCGAARLTVSWPGTQAGVCATWLREMAAVVVK